MSQKANPTLIGLFTLCGLVLAAAGLVLFGAGKFFEKSSRVMLYFDKSANGLLVGSEVRFGGVRIGRVTSIQVLVDQKNERKIIPVVVDLSEKELQDVGSTGGGRIDLTSAAGVENAVANGLRARMKQQSLLTGQLYVEFDIVPASPGFTYLPEVRPLYPTVPTMGAEMDELIAGVADGLKKFNALDLESSMRDFRDMLASAKEQVAALDVKAINANLTGITTDVRALTANPKLTSAINSLDETLASVNRLTHDASAAFPPLIKDFQDVIRQATGSLVKLDQTAADLSQVTNPRAPVLLRMQNALEEVERASLAIKELASDLKRNPNSILVGKAPLP